MADLSVRETAAWAVRETVLLNERATWLDTADAALAAVAAHDGLAEVLRKHVHNFDESDWHIDYGCRCGERYSRSGLDWGQEPCHDEHAAHLADVVRAWLLT